MLAWLDDFLIDRCFQPVADALARWISCYGIAAQAFATQDEFFRRARGATIGQQQQQPRPAAGGPTK
jgi:hypothetical protein